MWITFCSPPQTPLRQPRTRPGDTLQPRPFPVLWRSLSPSRPYAVKAKPLRGALRAALTAVRFGLFWSPCRKGSICCEQQPGLTGDQTEGRAVGKRKLLAGSGRARAKDASGEEGGEAPEHPTSTGQAERVKAWQGNGLGGTGSTHHHKPARMAIGAP